MKPAWLWVLLAALSPVVAADDLGRLFFTAEERRALDAARAASAWPVPPPPSMSTTDIDLYPESAPEAVPILSPTTVNGFVSRSRGPATVWVNGEHLEPDQVRLPGASDRTATLRRGALEFIPEGDQARQRVKPGQTYDPIGARVMEAYEQSTEIAP